MMYQQSPIFVLATLAAAGADVVADTTLGRLSIQESSKNKFAVPIAGLKVTKLETVAGATLLARKFKRDSYSDPVATISKKTTVAADEARTGNDLQYDLEKDPTSGVNYTLYEFEHGVGSTDHGGYVPSLRPKIYIYVSGANATNLTNFEKAITGTAGVTCLGGMATA